MVTTLSYLALVGPASAVVIWLISGVAGMIATIATLSLAADSCPEGAEGFAFAGMMSIINLTGPLSDTLGSALYQHVFNQRLAPADHRLRRRDRAGILPGATDVVQNTPSISRRGLNEDRSATRLQVGPTVPAI